MGAEDQGVSRARSVLVVLLLVGAAFIAGYVVGLGPRWVLWEIRGRVVTPTTEVFATRWGCTGRRDAWNEREEAKRKQEEDDWRKNNPNPAGLARLIGPITFSSRYECYPVGLNPSAERIR